MTNLNQNTYQYAKINYKNNKMFINLNFIDDKFRAINISIYHKGKKNDYGSQYDQFYEYNKQDEHKSQNTLTKRALKRTNIFSKDKEGNEEIKNFIKQLKSLLTFDEKVFNKPYIIVEPLK